MGEKITHVCSPAVHCDVCYVEDALRQISYVFGLAERGMGTAVDTHLLVFHRNRFCGCWSCS